MWNLIEKPAEQIAKYSTIFGQFWYLIVFIFRLIVVATIGSGAYSDEQSAFKCSTKVEGCNQVCYDRFAKISHIRFWSFQILALTSPVILFHFYTIFAEGRLEKLKEAEEKENQIASEKEKMAEVEPATNASKRNAEAELVRRRKKVGKVKERRRYNKDKLEDVTFTRGISLAYFASVLTRAVIELVFLYLAYDLFRFAKFNYSSEYDHVVSDGRHVQSFFDLFWIRVPQLYRCTGKTVRWACGQHMLPGNYDSYVPCWVSRPWEKTIFLRYMNTLSVVCLLLCIFEIIQLSSKFFKTFILKKKKSSFPYDRVPSVSSGDSHPIGILKEPKTDEFSTRNEIDETEAKEVSPGEWKEKENKKQNDIFFDLATGNLRIEDLRRVCNEPKDPPRDKSKSVSTLKLPEHSKDPKVLNVTGEEPRPKGRKRNPLRSSSAFPSGTQSLNRPPKVVKSSPAQLFQMGKISFTPLKREDMYSSDVSRSADEEDVVSMSNDSVYSDNFA